MKKSPADMPMVSYWKTKDAVEAKLTTDKTGALIMPMEGEDYPITTFPRGFLLFGTLSKLKHEIKVQIFNDSWARLENGDSVEEIVKDLKEQTFPKIFKILEGMKHDIVPEDRMYGPVREIHRAWTKIATNEMSLKFRDMLCLIIGDDDSYRFRVSWWAERFHRYRWFIRDPIKRMEKAFYLIENAEVIGDMKERERLWTRICLMLLKDPRIRQEFDAMCKEVDFKKLYLTKGDKYHYRGKYFKVDYELFEY